MGHVLMTICAAALLAGFAGCTPQDLSPAQTKTICRALVGPIKYNTYNTASQRYAAILLALDLKQRNQIWTALHCGGKRHG